MKQLTCSLLLTGLIAGASSSVLSAATTVIDDFNSYTGAGDGYVQTQNPAWSRFGNATADGIYSIAGGAEGRGAQYNASWGTNGFVRYAFSEPQVIEIGTVFSVDLQVSTALPGTQVFFQLAGAGAVYESAGQALTNTDYATFSFLVSEANFTLADGGVALTAVLADLQNITFRFSNTGGAGAQNINFDNLTVQTAAIPEPSAAALALGIIAVAAVGARRRRVVC